MTAFVKLEEDFTDNMVGCSALDILLLTCLGLLAIFQILNFGHGLLNMALVMICGAICSVHLKAILSVQKPFIINRLNIINGVIILIRLFI